MAFKTRPPKMVGMKKLDKSEFEIKMHVPAFRLHQNLVNSSLRKDLRNKLLKNNNDTSVTLSAILDLPRMKAIRRDHSNNNDKDECTGSVSPYRIILLDPGVVSGADPMKWPEDVSRFFRENNVDLVSYELVFDYDYWSIEDIYDSILPQDLPRHYSYETIGHIAHLNLKSEIIEYKYIIGEIILSKNQAIKTVVNKLGTINDVFRTLQMEVIAGEHNFITLIREGGCRFKLDFSKVYWNSKLQTEHQRLVDKYFSKNDLICDPFAGIGPFSLNAAKNKGSIVFACDMNPYSYKYLQMNIKDNKLEGLITPFLLDAKEFIATSMSILNSADRKKFVFSSSTRPSSTKHSDKRKKHTLEPLPPTNFGDLLVFNHYILNLPETSFTFLPYFRDAFRGFSNLPSMPTIHIYCFSRINSKDQAVLSDIFIPPLSEKLGIIISKSDIVEIHNVRKVAPSKSMYCISFKLSGQITNVDTN